MSQASGLIGSRLPIARSSTGYTRMRRINQLGGDTDAPEAGARPPDADAWEVVDRLDRELIGLAPVKTRVREIASLLVIDRLRRETGLTSEQPSLHMCFTGSPGTGKTTVAKRMAEILHRLGYSRKGHLVSVTRDDLVGQYIGHTAPKTREILKRAMGGILFIDEAYYLHRPENERDDLIVIPADYRDQMETFFQSNPGIKSRIAHHIDFPDFKAEELMGIADLMLQQLMYCFTEPARQTFADYLVRRMSQAHFANARSVRNAIDRIRLRDASRLLGLGRTLERDELMTIEPEDILKSRVFDEPADHAPSEARE